ncbi:DUF4383 domain-containing protein [Amycolatopsis sp.]|jgi:hypothetical protein|uniref:DUF4383 domain-containing protein n=1 Tax=Amycolatopsis sp. TaxID=37632 RepID=UPI002E04FEA2|nr:DUF4383 domain-containing protein [Amycolatopsis sp.]
MATESPSPWRPVRRFALLTGVVFLLVGVLGFIPGITTGYDELRFGGPHSDAKLFGVFRVSILHNLVHLLFGVAGVAASKHRGAARAFLMVGGGAYLVLWIYGVAIGHESTANFVPFNNADNWLHLGLGLGMIALGVASTALERTRGQYPEPDIQGQ